MAHLLGSVLFGILAHAQDTVVGTCSSVDKFVRHRVAVIIGILQFAAEQGAAMSANVARIWAAFWNADTSTVASIPVAMITDDMERSTAASDGTTSESSDSHTITTNNNDKSHNGGAAPLDVFTKARRKREKKRSSFNRTGRALNAQDKIHREASAPKSTASRPATKKPAVVASAEPVSPAASTRSAVAPGNGFETTRYAWQSFETLRTGPGDWLTQMEVEQPDGSVKWVRVNLSKK